MRKVLASALLAASGLAFGLGAESGEARKLLLIYSADERGELRPCG